MAWDNTLTSLNRVLAELYSDPAQARRIAQMAGISVVNVNFSGRAIDTWFAILDEAEKSGRSLAVAEATLNEYPEHPKLIAAAGAVRQRSSGSPASVEPPPPLPATLTHEDKIRIRDLIIKHCTLDDLRTICYDLAIDYESIPGGENKSAKARELVAYCDRRAKLPQLVAACRSFLPEAGW